jgi:hypothetical protein
MTRLISYRATLVALLSSVLLSLTPGTKVLGGIMRDDVPSSSYEAFAADPRVQSVGWVSEFTSGVYYVAGSGVLIDPSWVLTAGHVILGTDNNGFAGMRFRLGSSVYGTPTASVVADAWFPYPGYLSTMTTGTGSDIGLIHLSSPITSITAAERFRGTDQRYTQMYMSGYGDPGTSATGPLAFDGIKRAGTNIAEDLGFGSVESQYWLSNFAYPGGSDLQPLEWGTAPGDSGCGWFADIDGRSQLVGVNDFMWRNYGAGGYSGAIRVSLYNDWIDTTMASVPEPGSIGILVIGAFGLLRRRRHRETIAA